MKIMNLFPMITKRVNIFIDRSVKYIADRQVNNPDVLLDNDCDSLIICSDDYYNEIYDEVIRKYNISPQKIKSLNEYIIYLLENDDEFVFQPSHIRFDICTLCQLNCTGCYMRKNNYGTMGAGYTKYENFQRIIEDNLFIKSIEIANSGEAFLNPDIDKIISYAAEKNIKLTIILGTNFNSVSDNVA